MPPFQDLIGDVIGYWTPEDGDQLVGTLLQVGWDTDGSLAADIQPEEGLPQKGSPEENLPEKGLSEGEAPQTGDPPGKTPPSKAPSSKAPLRVRIGDQFWKDWSEASSSQGGPSRGDRVRITYRETPLMEPQGMEHQADAAFESETFESDTSEAQKPKVRQKTSARYVVEVVGKKKPGEEKGWGAPGQSP